ncbi:LysM peptidoglycan-binding domain-containing protein [Thioclava sp. BHET1]|nr:LysM peptidoglycan-binding domain-containing protein [Thioclava sp. BHET1]
MSEGSVQEQKAKAAAWSGGMWGGVSALGLVVLALMGWAYWYERGTPDLSASGAGPMQSPGAASPERAAETGAAGTTQSAAVSTAPQTGADPTAEASQSAASATPSTLSDTATAAAPQSDAGSGGDARASDATAQVQFDALRATPDGSITLAGRVAPGASVEILVNGQPVAKTQADGSGSFASLFDLPPSTAPRALSLRVTGTDGVARESAESVVLRPAQSAQGTTEIASAAPAADGTAPVADSAAAQGAAADPAQGQTPAPIVTDASGARLLAPSSDQLVIDTIAFGRGQGASAQGRGAPAGTTLSAYLDDKLVGQTTAGQSGRWVLDLPGLTPGGHSLRIDATAPDGADAGKVVARAETSFDQPSSIVVVTEGAQGSASGSTGAAPGAASDGVKVVQIVRGNTLWAIAREVYGDGVLYVRVFDANRDQIRNPDLIYPGQVFNIPAAQ